MALINAVDAAFPQLNAIPGIAKVVLGYAGAPGHTPHIWTVTEVNAVRSTGRAWWPIWVPAQGVMSASSGEQAAVALLDALPRYAVDADTPCFLDVEQSSWQASAAGALAAVGEFKAAMRLAGHSRAYGYLPRAAGFDWIANWTNTEPSSLPSGVIGHQYMSTRAWDYSVFDASLLGAATTAPTSPAGPPQEADDVTYIRYIRDSSSGAIWECNIGAGTRWHVPNSATLDERKKVVAGCSNIQVLAGQPSVDPSELKVYGVEIGA